LGAYSTMARQIAQGRIKSHPRTEMLDLVTIDGRARGIIVRDLQTGKIESYAGDAVVLATGGYGPVFFLSTNAVGCNVTATYRAHKRGALFANPCFTQIHPTCIPVTGDYQAKLTLMSESLRNDGRIWVPKKQDDKRAPDQIPEAERDYFLERKYPSFGNLAPRDISSRAAKEVCDAGKGVGEGGRGVYLDFTDAIKRLGENLIRERYGNLFDMYHHITNENPYKAPMRIYPAVHYCMGGLWVDYTLMSNVSGLFVLGEANFSDHGANRLGASALMQGLSDGYFVAPYTITNYLASTKPGDVTTAHSDFKRCENDVNENIKKVLSIKGNRSPLSIHRELGKVVWNEIGMARSRKSLTTALQQIPAIREDFWKNVSVPGSGAEMNKGLEYALRVSDFLEFAELLAEDALAREESCGAHFREEYQTEEGEATRNDQDFAFVSAWEYKGMGNKPQLHKEALTYDNVHLAVRSYK